MDELLRAGAVPTAAVLSPAESHRFPAGFGVASILGASPAMAALRRDVRLIARSEASTVLLQGESGTGKDLIARVLHAESERAAKPFLALNCSAVPESLFEAELFGYEPGAFTDARRRKHGLVETAHGGTVFLDEVAELGPSLQARLLRFLEDRTFRRLGGTTEHRVDLRFVAATNVDLAEAARLGRFRRDLYFRLGVISCAIPPLRAHREDVPLLARHYLEHYGRRFHRRLEGFEPDALDALVEHPWPGNVRELANAIERVVLLREGPWIRREDLLLDPVAPAPAAAPPEPATGEPDLVLEHVELRALVRALELACGNQSEAARRLAVSRDTVRHLMKKHRVRVEARVVVEGSAPAGPRESA